MTVRVKICGIHDAIGFDTAVQAGADWIGFVFFPPSPRFVLPARAAELSARSPGGPPRVGLFVDPTEAAIEAALAEIQLDVLQIYGVEDRLPAFRARFGLPIWRAKGVATAADLPKDTGGADAWLLDAKPPKHADRPGGLGVTFDWDLLKALDPELPFMLSGGLTPDSVGRAIKQVRPFGVDVSSGVETAPGVKDAGLIRAFIEAARAAA